MLDGDARERQVEQGIMDHLQRFLVKSGVGFAFLGRQHRFEVDGDEFFIDLLFYHVKLRSYIVVELKATDFQPAYAGQLNFYVTAVNNLLRTPEDQPTIGLLLCRGKKTLVVEWALQGTNGAIGVAEYQLTNSIPVEFKGKLPTLKELEAELGDAYDCE
ncbi:MAG: PDDEXK nuclease domain-containing protein [Planctomycetota bacterium]